MRIQFVSSFSPFYQMLAGYFYYIVPTGYDPTKPVGTGAIQVQDLQPGRAKYL